MTKKLTEKEAAELSEEQLSIVNGGYTAGDVCPKCGEATLVNHRYYNIVYCPKCDFEEGDSRSR